MSVRFSDLLTYDCCCVVVVVVVVVVGGGGGVVVLVVVVVGCFAHSLELSFARGNQPA